MLDEEGGHVRRRHGFCRGYENGLFRKLVHDNEDCVMIVARRKIRYPVERDTTPRPGRDWERIEKSIRHVAHDIVALTRITAADIVVDSCRESRPLEVLCH